MFCFTNSVVDVVRSLSVLNCEFDVAARVLVCMNACLVRSKAGVKGRSQDDGFQRALARSAYVKQVHYVPLELWASASALLRFPFIGREYLGHRKCMGK